MNLRGPSLAALLGATLALALGTSCAELWRTQLWPEPMVPAADPLPKGVDSDTPPGLVDVLAYRHADPVLVRPASTPTAFPLTHYRKKQRLRSGSWLHVAAGGRAELFWPSDGAKVIFFDDGICRIGDPSRGEPDLRVEVLTRLEIELGPGAVVQLPNGCLLSGSPEGAAGPYLVERIYDELIRVFNQSREPAYVAFREERLTLEAGERVDLPLLEAGADPVDLGGPPVLLSAEGLRVSAYGPVEEIADDAGLRLRSSGSGVLFGQGVAVRLGAGEEVVFLDLPGGVTPRGDGAGGGSSEGSSDVAEGSAAGSDAAPSGGAP